MKVIRKDLEKGQVELNIELSVDELKPLMEKGAESISKELKVEGFRPGKVPFDVLKQKVGELAILEEAAKLSINKNIYKVLEENIKDKEVIGQPEVGITKIAVGSPLEYKVKVNILPEVTVGKYKDFAIEKEGLKVTEEEVNKVLNDLVEMRAKEKISDKVIEKGNKVIASVNLFVENVPVEDGQNPEVTVMIGKDYFVEGFDKNLIGLKKGDKKEFNLVYPDKHWQKNIAGKLVDFKVEIKEVYTRELPELNDDLAKIFQFNSMDQLKENLSKTIETQKRKEMDQKIEVKILDKVVENFKFGEIAESLVKSEASLMMREMEQSVTSQGGKFEDYLNSIKKTQNELMLEILPGATKRVKSALALKKIAELEKISVSDAEMEKELDILKKKYENDAKVIENLSSSHYKAYLENMILNQKTVEALKKWNIQDENFSDK